MTALECSPSFTLDLDIHLLAGRIGAEIDNVRLAGNLPEPAIAAIEAALAKYKVIFFRNQSHLDDAEQERFAARLGDIVAHPTSPRRAGTAILELDSTYGRGRADRWHTDMTFLDAYPKISVLRGVVIPPYGGDTVWANTVAAYDGLPPLLKTLVEGLWAVHSNLYDYAAARPQASAAATKQYEEVFTSTVFETEHPVVRVLDTGERSLVLGFLPPVRRLFAIGLEPSVRDAAIPRDQARKHRALALACGRCRNLGQYRHATLRHQ